MNDKNSVRLPSYLKPERYKITIKPDLKKFSFNGEETIFLDLLKPSRTIVLHANQLKVFDVEYKVKNKKHIPKKIAYDPKKHLVAFYFNNHLPKGKAELFLKFEGVINERMHGIYRSKYEHQGETRHLMTTQFESTDARRAFLCVDEPAAKAVFDVTMIVPKHHVAISNTVPSVVKEHQSGYKLVQFEPTPKMSTYLLALISGEFEAVEGKTKEGILVRVFTTPGKKHQAEFALDVGIKALSFFNDYFGIPYPLPVLDMIAIPDFSAGAMENWGAITYREVALLFDPEHSALPYKQQVAMT